MSPKNRVGASRRASSVAEPLEPRRLLSGQFFSGQGPLAGKPAAVVVADFNNDGHPDLLTPGSGASVQSGLGVRLGDGAGGFTFPPFATPSVTGGRAAAVGDLNGDGKPDVVLATASGASVLIGGGSGDFTQLSAVPPVGAPTALIAADLNADGRIDLIATTGKGVYVAAGNGDGTFAAATVYLPGSSPGAAVLGDFNADGRPDLAVTLGASNTVSVLPGTGGGGFGAPTAFAVGGGPAAIVTGDFNGDGRADLAVANRGGNSVSVLLGDGVGGFGGATTTAVGTAPRGLATADLNGDGKADLVVTASTDNTLAVLAGDGTGGFTTTATLGTGTAPYGVVAADINGDGRPDVAVANSGEYADSVFLNDAGKLTPAVAATTALAAPAQAGVSADFDGDGVADLAVTNFTSTATVGTVSVLRGNGNGTFAAGANPTVGAAPYAIVTADFNGDGRADLATANYNANTVSILLGNGDGTFAAATTYAVGTHPQSLVAGDFNGDGRADLVVANSGSTNLTLALNNGNGTFETGNLPLGYNSYAAQVVVSGDFNKDGKLDLAVAAFASSAPGVIAVLQNGGTANFTLVHTYATGGYVFNTTASTTVYNTLAAGDFNGDGNLDLESAYYTDNLQVVLLGKGDGAFSNGQSGYTSVAGGAGAPVVADFDGDGVADLAAVSSGGGSTPGGELTVLHGLSGDTLSGLGEPAGVSVPKPLSGLVVGDFDHDGRPDLATINTAGGVSVVLNRARANPNVQFVAGVLSVSGATTATLSLATDPSNTAYLTVNTPARVEIIRASAVKTLTFDGATVNVTSDLGGLAALTALTVGPTAAVTFSVGQHLPTLTVNGTATLTPGGKLLKVTGLDVAGRLDLNDGDLLYDYTGTTPQQTTVRGLIATGRAGGAWTGFGLTSTAAKNDAATATTLGYLEASDYLAANGANATFDGETLDNTAVLVRYTLYGDADLNRAVTVADFNRLAAAFNAAGTVWGSGDFNDDGSTTIADFNALAAHFNASLSAAGAVTAAAGHVTLTPPGGTPAKTAGLSGSAFDDANGDGRFDGRDKYTAGKRVFLDLDDDGVPDANEPSVLTDQNGKFTFDGLAAGTYHVRRVFAKGYVASTARIDLTLTPGHTKAGLLIGTKKA